MIVKESISTEQEGILNDVGTQQMTLRPEKWYRDFIIKHGKTVNTHGDRKSFIPTRKFNLLMKNKNHAITLKKFDKQIKSTAVITTVDGVVITAFKINKRMNWRNK